MKFEDFFSLYEQLKSNQESRKDIINRKLPAIGLSFVFFLSGLFFVILYYKKMLDPNAPLSLFVGFLFFGLILSLFNSVKMSEAIKDVDENIEIIKNQMSDYAYKLKYKELMEFYDNPSLLSNSYEFEAFEFLHSLYPTSKECRFNKLKEIDDNSLPLEVTKSYKND